VAVRRSWPDVLEALGRRSKATLTLMSQNAQVLGVDGRSLQLGVSHPGIRDMFVGSPREEQLRAALTEVVGGDWRIDAIVAPTAGSAPGGGSAPQPPAPRASASAPASTAATPATAARGAANTGAPAPSAPTEPASAEPAPPEPPDDDGYGDPYGAAPPSAASAAASATGGVVTTADAAPADESDDADAASGTMTSRELLARELNATLLTDESTG
jgi:DNA polymerase-3 subunit gamma/tau